MLAHLNVQVMLEPTPTQLTYQGNYLQTEVKGVIQADFELAGGLIFLNANLNGATQPFVLDTGCPHLVLNNNFTQEKSSFSIQGIGGRKNIKKLYKVDFDWEGIRLKRNASYSLNLNNISRVKNRSLAGLIGYDQVKTKELVIDYEKKKLFLVGKSNKDFFEHYERVDRVWFRMVGHLPVIKVKIGKKRYYFGIDTGAEINVIDKRLRKRFPKEMIVEDFSGVIMGGDSKKIQVNNIKVKEMKVGKSYYQNQPFAFADISYLQGEDGIQLDGLLGYPFLKEALFSVNYKKKQLCKWDLKVNDEEFIQLAISKKRIKLTKPLSNSY